MSDPSQCTSWKVYQFKLLVTGKGEKLFLDRLCRSICNRMAQTGRGSCAFLPPEKIGQLTPRTSTKRLQKMPGQRMRIPSRDEDAALLALGFLKQGGDFVLLIDDLEAARKASAEAVHSRYREALDHVLPVELRYRASVHFLVNMVEAYYFADAKAINAVMKTNWTDYEGDVETIDHPKRELKAKLKAFDEVEDGEKIMRCLDVPHVLSRPDTCASLRSLFGWCWRALRLPPGTDYQLEKGCYFDVTRSQIDRLPAVNGSHEE